MKLLKEKGYKLTSQRRQIIEALRLTGRRASAREIYEALSKDNPHISMDTVYRNLRLLTEIGVVHQISLQSGAVFELDDKRHHHHLVCVDCEEVVCIPYCPEAKSYNEFAGSAGFEVLGHVFEVYGRCAACREKK
ncbi:Fur family transcriptional regulator [Dethiobacter alkaliphilus]|uniref:Fur family transcriptional regulator n=1 Tax=Dethiobacter alkaliphilus TaxID=427926 RepID=UPI00222620B8|nr:Fur family transcriptional regulator [Dethiobacter alkaliphilus]MCW3489197.1 transcriptional repressor [Dethiobacter alkaliphilus]